MDVEESLLLSRASGTWTYICAAYCVLDRDKRLQRMASDRADQDSHDSPKSGESEADSKNVLFPVHLTTEDAAYERDDGYLGEAEGAY
jgi:hypothetical protein